VNSLIALKRVLRRLTAKRTARAGVRTPHICYALSLGDDTTYADLLNISAQCVRRVYPAARITVLTDDQSLPKAREELYSLIAAGAGIQSVGRFDGSVRQRSRFIKTQVRNILDGEFLFLDVDTVAVAEFSDILECELSLSAAIDRNLANPDGGFPAWVVPDFNRLGWPHPTALYLNTGVVFWKDNDEARALGRMWHRNWLHYTTSVDNPADQPAFNHSLDILGIRPKIMSDVFNARVGVSPRFADGAKIYHLLSGEERANGTFIDQLLVCFRTTRKVDHVLIDEVAERGTPWIAAKI